jgi:dihydropteroate synthase
VRKAVLRKGESLLRLWPVPAAKTWALVDRFRAMGLPLALRQSRGGGEMVLACPPGEVSQCTWTLREEGEDLAAILLMRAVERRRRPEREIQVPLPRNRILSLSGKRPIVMGVVNVTQDSFYAQSRTWGREDAVRAAREMVGQGAAVLDVGGESTRPGAEEVPAEEETARVVPVIAAIRESNVEVVISVDTRKALVAEKALDAGADMVNDVSAGGHDPALLPLVAERGVPIVLMHMQGAPESMQSGPAYADVLVEVCLDLWKFWERARAAGVSEDRVILDPGIGFGKTAQHNLTLLQGCDTLMDLGFPLLLGTSRKSFLGWVLDLEDPARRLASTLATVALAAREGAHILRVHDVEPTRHVIEVVRAIREAPIA